jgi:hypothetical protein
VLGSIRSGLGYLQQLCRLGAASAHGEGGTTTDCC